MNAFIGWYQGLNKLVKGILIFSTTALSISLIFLFNLIFIGFVAGRIMAPIQRSDKLLDSSIEVFPRPDYLPVSYYNVLKSQDRIMKERKTHHWELARLFFRNYYSILFLTILIASLGGLTLFVVVNRGWATAGVTLQTFFLTLLTALAFLGFFPVVFKQQENFAQNMTYYENYGKGQLRIYNQLSDLQNPFKDKKDGSNVIRLTGDSMAFFHRLDSIVGYNQNYLADLNNYVLSIDPDQAKNITINKVYSEIQAALKATTDTTK
jgi:hypothetical protein